MKILLEYDPETMQVSEPDGDVICVRSGLEYCEYNQKAYKMCNECGWVGDVANVLIAKNPFDSSEEVDGCPNCRDVNTIIEVEDDKRD